MRNRTLLSTLTAFIFAAFIVDAARADTTWQASGGVWDGNWNDSNHWSAGVPDENDKATFPAGSGSYTVTVNVSLIKAQSLDMHANCSNGITLGSNQELQLGSADGQRSVMDIGITLTASTSVLRLMYDHKFQPKTANTDVTVISGSNASASIDDDSDGAPNPSTLTLESNGTGEATIDGTLTFALDRLRIESAVVQPIDSSFSFAGTFAAFEIAGGTLQFTSAFTGLSCAFNLSAGTLDVDQNVCTSGNLSFTGGVIDVAASKSYKASGTCP